MWTPPREYTVKLMDLVDEGVVDKDYVISGLLNWLSEADVYQFCVANFPELFDDVDEDDEDEEE
jgi:hypothetical protein